MMNYSALSGTWNELEQELLDKGYLTHEEVDASNLRVSIIGKPIKAKREQGVGQN